MNISKIILYNQPNFDIKQIFECGQAFRFNKTSDNGYEGIAFGLYIKLNQEKNNIIIYTNEDDFKFVWHNFFDLDRDYQKIIDALSCDEIMNTATNFGSGIRILKQDLFESIISFIISQQNNIPRIKSIIECFCQNFGDKLIVDNRIFYTFPTLEKLKNVSVNDLSVIKCGFRAKYIKDAIEKIASKEVNLDDIYSMDTTSARCELLKIKGIGAKVADCILLFGAGKLDAFPIDVWIGRAIEVFYRDKNFTPNIFGQYAGIAQQYLFYYARENKIKI